MGNQFKTTMRKRRTRQHFIEDLGFNYAERHLLLARCTLHRINIDYGFDAEIRTYSENGEVENGFIHVQIKSTDKIKILKSRNVIVFDLSKKDLEYWLAAVFPVVILIYDAKNNVGYFLLLQEYFRENRILLNEINKFIRIYIPPENKFNVESVLKMRDFKNYTYGNIRNI